MTLGILFAFLAMFFWGFGDFLIQRSTRKFGDWETLFIICTFGVILLLPFVWNKLPSLLLVPSKTLIILLAASLALFIAALLEFEALRRGKISVIEPTWSLEIPSSAVLAFFVLGEVLSFTQVLFIIALIIGLFLVSYRGTVFSKKFFLERGVIISIFSAVGMGVANFFVGWGARETDPLVINFLISLFSMIGAFIFLVAKGRVSNTVSHFKNNLKLLLTMSFLDNAAWVAFAFAMTLAPIGIAAALSESYIIIAVLLGIFVTREKLQSHQKGGLAIAVLAAIVLAAQIIF